MVSADIGGRGTKIYIVIDIHSEDAKSLPYIVGAFDSEYKAKEAMASYIEQFAGTDDYSDAKADTYIQSTVINEIR